jgi:hypothetical protein
MAEEERFTHATEYCIRLDQILGLYTRRKIHACVVACVIGPYFMHHTHTFYLPVLFPSNSSDPLRP